MSTRKRNTKVYWFHKEECKFCKEMEGEWAKVEKKLIRSGIDCQRIDITDPKHKKITENFDIKSVPHIVKINSNGTREVFKGTRKQNDIITWIYENDE